MGPAGTALNARKHAFLLLKFRPRSTQEIIRRLKQKKYPQEIIASTVDFLTEKKFLDDAAFARAWCESRLKKPLGLRKIRQELIAKGINNKIIVSCLNKLRETYNEAGTIRDLARQKFEKLKNADPRRAQQRVYAYLIRRGFSPDETADAVEEL